MDNFIKHFSTTYEEIFQKVTVSDAVTNSRFESKLSYGQTVTRFTLADNIRIRDVVNDYDDRVIDNLEDEEELLTINKQKSANFRISRKDRIQNGPLSAAAVQGGRVAKKMAIQVDSDVFSQVSDAYTTFDTGDLTGLGSNGTPIVFADGNLYSTLTKLRAKLRRNNIGLEGTVFVMDSFATAVVEANRLGKEISSAETTFRNGFAGKVLSSQWFVSENLTGEAVMSASANPANGDTFVIEGITWTIAASPADDSNEILRGANTAATMANIVAEINNPTKMDADDQIKMEDALQLSATVVGGKVVFLGIGAGRLNIAVTGTFAIDKNFIHAYFGKRSTIDLVMQDKMSIFETQEPRKPVKNYLTEFIYGYDVFEDSKQQYIDVLIDVSVS
jgi:hypothetical protein